MHNFRRTIVLALALVTPVSHAAIVHKCVADDGAVSYQSDSCPVGTRAQRHWDSQALREPGSAELARRNAERERDSAYLERIAQRRSRPARLHLVRAQSSTCEAIKARRDTQLRRRGNAMSFEVRRRWNNRVYEACK